MDDFGLLIGRFFTTLPTLSDEQLSELQLDSKGRLIISGRYLEDSAHVSGDAGLFMMGVRNDADAAMTSADGDYSPLSVDEFGRLKVLADLDVDFDYVYDEDSAASSGATGAYVLAVRQDTLATSTSADGDFSSFKVNAKGELYVHDVDVKAELVTANAALVTIDTSLNNIETSTGSMDTKLTTTNSTLATIDTSLNNIEADTATIASDTTSMDATLTALSKAEDAIHASGDQGIMALAVRKDADTAFAADGDYTPLQTDAFGKLKVSAVVAAFGAENYVVTDALAAAGDGLIAITAAATPWITVASLSVGAGTSAFLYGWQWACDQNAQARIVTDDTTDVIVYKTTVNSSATPGMDEHFADNGRIEIAGSAGLEVKLQIKKRSSTGGNANGTGSMHIRTA